MTFSIANRIREGAWGGGNQFLKALRKEFIKRRIFEEMEKAEVILFNSYPSGSEEIFLKILKIKSMYPQKLIVHRINGPIHLYRGRDKDVDEIIYVFNRIVADGTIFQSRWCRGMNYNCGMKKNKYEAVIINAPDSELFNKKGKKPFCKDKVKLVTTSWSANPRKGFDIYKFIDENLDQSKYSMTFIGRSPYEFKRIKMLPFVKPEILPKILKEHDIFILASKLEACSNALLEALHCGLPAVVRNSSSNPEILGEAGETFNGREDVFKAVDKVTENYEEYQSKISLPSIQEVCNRYLEFAMKIYKDVLNGRYEPKRPDLIRVAEFIGMLYKVYKWKAKSWLGYKLRLS